MPDARNCSRHSRNRQTEIKHHHHRRTYFSQQLLYAGRRSDTLCCFFSPLTHTHTHSHTITRTHRHACKHKQILTYAHKYTVTPGGAHAHFYPTGWSVSNRLPSSNLARASSDPLPPTPLPRAVLYFSPLHDPCRPVLRYEGGGYGRCTVSRREVWALENLSQTFKPLVRA